MIDEIKIFLFVLSVLFLLKHLFVLGINLFSENPKPMELNTPNQTGLFLSIAYIITYLII
jgi:hypothetical protein